MTRGSGKLVRNIGLNPIGDDTKNQHNKKHHDGLKANFAI